MKDTHERARKLVAEHLGAHIDRIEPDAGFADDLNADSLDSVELAFAVEDEFGIELNDDDVEQIFGSGKFSDLTAWLDRNLA